MGPMEQILAAKDNISFAEIIKAIEVAKTADQKWREKSGYEEKSVLSDSARDTYAVLRAIKHKMGIVADADGDQKKIDAILEVDGMYRDARVHYMDSLREGSPSLPDPMSLMLALDKTLNDHFKTEKVAFRR